MCDHKQVTIYYKEVARETRYQPAEYTEFAECDECGEQFDPSDVEGAEVTDSIKIDRFFACAPGDYD